METSFCNTLLHLIYGTEMLDFSKNHQTVFETFCQARSLEGSWDGDGYILIVTSYTHLMIYMFI